MKRLALLLLLIVISISSRAQNNKMTNYDSRYGENYQSIAFDGGWNDSFRNQVLFFGGKFNRTYTAWLDTYGDIVVGYIDNETKAVSSFIVEDNKKRSLETCSLSLLFMPDGKLMLFVADTSNLSAVRMYKMKEAENITQWDVKNIKISGKNIVKSTYPVMLAGENNKIMLFTQLANGALLVTTSDDLGQTWRKSEGVAFAKGHRELKIATDNQTKIAFAINNNILAIYDKGVFDINGKRVGDNLTADIAQTNLSSAPVSGASIADLSIDNMGNIAIISISKDKTATYSVLGKKGWNNNLLPIKNLIGDIVIDKETPSTMYYVALNDSITEINKISEIKGKWSISPITLATTRNNYSVASVSNALPDQPIQICWLQETVKDVKVNLLTSIKADIQQPVISDVFKTEDIKKIMKKVADWQLTRSFIDKQKNDWHWGAFYVGLIAAYEATGDTRYWDELMNVGQLFDWELREDVMHGDRPLVCEIYSYIYDKSGRKDPNMMKHTEWAMNLHSSRQAPIDVRFEKNEARFEWWSWCDALFMAPAAFFKYSQITGDKRAMEFAHKQWIATADYLYSKSDSLFFRDDRYFNKKSTNGNKMFWARGNGWVMGAIPRILDILPQDHKYRPYYENLFKEMAAKMLSIQRPEGLWTVNLLDPEELLVGESSGSGFYGYAFAWGVNNGLLDVNTYGPAARKAWKALSNNVSSFGRLGYVQQVAGEPYPFYEYQSHTYASGAFLLFANEMIKFN